ncbi:MAG: PilZ domain-containing protein [Acidobacteria bacterium]|nr:PilZ domain-containing protein [Acidobacteriota bacterium]
MNQQEGAIFVAILSKNREEEKAITDAVEAFKSDYMVAHSISHLRDILMEQPCNGLLFCIASLVGIDQAGKSFVQTLEQVYPVARIRLNKQKGTFSLIASRSGRVETIADFIHVCSKFHARCLRRSERLSKTLNVLASADPDFSDPMRTFTVNVSPRGCFLYSSREWDIGETVFIQIQELPGRSTIEGMVIRYVPWGVPFHIQGIGIQFINTENRQIEELQHLLYDLPGE